MRGEGIGDDEDGEVGGADGGLEPGEVVEVVGVAVEGEAAAVVEDEAVFGAVGVAEPEALEAVGEGDDVRSEAPLFAVLSVDFDEGGADVSAI